MNVTSEMYLNELVKGFRMKDPHFFYGFRFLIYRKVKGPFFLSEMPVSCLFCFFCSSLDSYEYNVSHMNLIKSLFIPSTPKGKLQFAPFFM